MSARYRVDWDELSVIEPTLDEVRTHAPTLAVAYNDPENAPLLGHTSELAEADVIEHYESLFAQGARPFLLLEGGALAGDADLRGIAGTTAEFAFLIASPASQGKGLGTRFAIMIHALAFAQRLERIYASVIPANTASRRVFEKLGYVEDTSDDARAYGDPGDVVLSLERGAFTARHAVADLRIAVR